MSYFATYVGKITLKENADVAFVSNELMKYFEFYDNSITVDGKAVTTFVLEGSGKYREDTVYPVLDAITEHVEKASIEFVGEDDAMWKIYFTGVGWNELPGYKVYSEEDAVKVFPNMQGKIQIPLGDGNFLCAEPYGDSDYKEIYIFLKDADGNDIQTIAMVQEQSHYAPDVDCLIHDHGKYAVKVWQRPDEYDDYTKSIEIEKRRIKNV